MPKRPSTELPVIEYSGPGPHNSGCGSFFLQAIGGFFLPFVGVIAAHALIPRGASLQLVLYISVGIQCAELLLAIVLLMRGRPGYFIGFVSAVSILGLLVTACGIRAIV